MTVDTTQSVIQNRLQTANMESTIETSRSKDKDTFQVPEIILSLNEPTKSLRFSTPEAETIDELIHPRSPMSPRSYAYDSQLNNVAPHDRSNSKSPTPRSKSPSANLKKHIIASKPEGTPSSIASTSPRRGVISPRSPQITPQRPYTQSESPIMNLAKYPPFHSKPPVVQSEVTTAYFDSLSPTRSPRSPKTEIVSYGSESPVAQIPSNRSGTPILLESKTPFGTKSKPPVSVVRSDSPSLYYDALSPRHVNAASSRTRSPAADRLMSSPTKFEYAPRSLSSPIQPTVNELPSPRPESLLIDNQSPRDIQSGAIVKVDHHKPSPASFQHFWNSTEPDRTQQQTQVFVPSLRLVGELAFQLDRRILNYVFNSVRHSGNRTRFYGYLVKNIPEMINKQVSGPEGRIRDVALASILNYRYKYVLYSLEPLGYDANVHADLCIKMVSFY